ncbi:MULTISPECIES: ABC transporter permease [Saccharibacillus]|uniref:ABC transporter permease n=1 Tax=Saccharibacillus TaxID=456492 RepID=UPI00123B3ABB|nr:ABC transporter permease [Saccharibacillus sp. WB 17]MWJ31807.1 ABC transporter permease [Saccharibacillus sp. WB 17]
MRAFGIVFGYSFRERVRSHSFKWMTLLLVALIAAVVLIPRFLGDPAPTQGTVAVINESRLAITQESLGSAVSPAYAWELAQPGESAAETARLQGEDLAAVVRIENGADAAAAPRVTLSVNRREDVDFAQNLTSYIERLNANARIDALGLTTAQAAAITAQPDFAWNEIGGGRSMAETYLPVYALIVLLFFMIYLFAGNVATSVSVEKGSRIQEILITKVSPGQLLAGKITGVALAGILQFAIIFGFGALMVNFAGTGTGLSIGSLSIDLSILGGQTLFVSAALFVLGYFFYSTLFAAAGSTVSRSEELNQATMPVSMLLMAGFMVAMISLGNPDGTLAVVSSYIPFLTPMVLLARVGAGDPALAEILLPLAILAVSTLVVGWVSARIYRGGVLLYGQKPSLLTLLKMLGSPAAKTSRSQAAAPDADAEKVA